MDQSLKQPCKKFVLRLESIAEIMENINGEIDQSTAFYILLDHIATHLDVDAVALYVTKNGEKLENIARLGFRLNDHVKAMGSDEGGQAKKVLSTGKAIRYNQTTGNSTTEKFFNFMRQEGFYDYFRACPWWKTKILPVCWNCSAVRPSTPPRIGSCTCALF